MFSKVSPVALASLFLAGIPAAAHAEPEPAPPGFDRVTARIDHADLDLSTTKGQVEFRKRVRSGIERMCTLSDPNNSLAGSIRRECVALSREAAEQQVAVALRKARERAGAAALAAR